ncbi:MAG: hypothetical protein ACI4MI_01980 [Christensenellales bacterium]
MLSQQATEFLSRLCAAIPSGKYTIKEWRELSTFLDDESDAKGLFDQLKINGCVDVKYKSDDEVCFALTDKATLVSQEFNSLIKQDEKAQVVTTNAGNVIVVSQENQTKAAPKGRLASFIYGLLGGLLGGCIGGGAVYAILSMLIGG